MRILFDVFRWYWMTLGRRGWRVPHLRGERVEVLSPEQFLRIYRRAPGTIKTADVVPPEMGAEGFGQIVVIRDRAALPELVER